MAIRKIILGSFFLFTGCSGFEADYDPANVIIPQHIKAIAVKPFGNETSQPGIGNKLWLATTQEFISDGRIRYTDTINQAQGLIEGTVMQYRETELSFDQNLIPREYQLWVVMNLKFIDTTENKYIWEEPNLEQKLRYFVETEPGGLTQEEAREQLWERFAQDIVRRTIEGFGTVTGSSPREVPRTTKENPPPVYPKTAPY